MKINPDTKIIDEVRNELVELAANVSAQEYMAESVKRIERWISFIDEIQKQREPLVQLASSIGYTHAFITGNGSAKELPVAPHEEERDGSPLPKEIREVALQELTKRRKWMATAELGKAMSQYDAFLSNLKSSLISASMDYGRKKGLFSAKFVGNTKYWGLPEWGKDGGKGEGSAPGLEV